MSSLKETSIQNPEPLRNSSEKINLPANKYCASITPRAFKTKAKKRQMASQLKCNGGDNICLLTKTTSPLFGKRLWEMRHGRAVYVSVLHLSSWNVYLPLDFVNYLITQPIWLGVSWAQYEKFAHKVSIKEWIYDGMDTDHDCNYKRVTNWKPQALILPNPAAQKRSKSSPETELQGNSQTLNFWICPSRFHGTPTYTFRNS